MKIDITSSKEFELQRIKNTLSKIDWFFKYGYKIHLPSKLNNKLGSEIKDREIIEILDLDYESSEYEKSKKFIEEQAPLFLDSFIKEVNKTDLVLLKEYQIYLTRYGVGGSYNIPNIIVLNINFRSGMALIRTIFHEIVHLAIEKDIQDKNISHWYKERIVDLLVAKFLSKISKLQEIPIDTYEIDDIFNKNYPNIGRILELVGEIGSRSK